MDAREVLRQRLLANREIDANGCWLWTRSTLGHMAYGQITWPGPERNSILAHRASAFVWMGFDIFSDVCVLHRCDVPRCFNPEHLFFGTKADNQRDMARKGRSRNKPHRGEENHQTPFTNEDILSMRRIADEANHRRGVYTELARQHGVSPQAIRMICLRRTWTHLP